MSSITLSRLNLASSSDMNKMVGLIHMLSVRWGAYISCPQSFACKHRDVNVRTSHLLIVPWLASFLLPLLPTISPSILNPCWRWIRALLNWALRYSSCMNITHAINAVCLVRWFWSRILSLSSLAARLYCCNVKPSPALIGLFRPLRAWHLWTELSANTACRIAEEEALAWGSRSVQKADENTPGSFWAVLSTNHSMWICSSAEIIWSGIVLNSRAAFDEINERWTGWPPPPSQTP